MTCRECSCSCFEPVMTGSYVCSCTHTSSVHRHETFQHVKKSSVREKKNFIRQHSKKKDFVYSNALKCEPKTNSSKSFSSITSSSSTFKDKEHLSSSRRNSASSIAADTTSSEIHSLPHDASRRSSVSNIDVKRALTKHSTHTCNSSKHIAATSSLIWDKNIINDDDGHSRLHNAHVLPAKLLPSTHNNHCIDDKMSVNTLALSPQQIAASLTLQPPPPPSSSSSSSSSSILPKQVNDTLSHRNEKHDDEHCDANTTTPKVLDFALRLPHAFDKVQDQLETGMAEVYRLKQFATKLCELQAKFADEMSGLIRKERDKMKSWRKPDFMVSCCTSVFDIFERVEMMASIHRWFATEMRLAVVEPLDTFSNIGSQILHQVLEKERAITVPMDARRAFMERRKIECMRLLSLHGNSMGLHMPETAKKRPTNILKKFVATKGKDGAKEKHASNVLAAIETYSEEIDTSNHLLKQYTSSSIPEVLTEMQNLEEMRLNSVRVHLEKLGALLAPVSTMFAKLSSNLVDSAMKIDVESDIKNFSKTTATQYAEGSRRLVPFVYDLDVKLCELRTALRASSNESLLFKVTLESIMRFQRDEYPLRRIPRVFTMLRAVLLRDDALNTEGIFRISAEACELKSLAAKIDEGIYTHRSTSPHVTAGLLKKWLRELSEPLIDTQLYNECVTIGEQEVNSVSASDIMSIVKRLPDTRRLLVMGIVCLIREFAANEEKNRMSAKNLVIVFAPSLMRCPDTDPIVMLKNAQFECQFIGQLVEHCDVSEYPLSEQNLAMEDLKLLDTSLSSNTASAGINQSQTLHDETYPQPPPVSNRQHENASSALPSAPSSSRRHSLCEAQSSPCIDNTQKPIKTFGRPGPVPAQPPLPPRWRSATGPDGSEYFFNVDSKDTQWNRPSL